MNKVILIGRLTRDPEMRTTMSGANVTRFTLAVNRPFQDQNGERGADFINCVAWRKQAENIAKYCVKGTQVAIEGRIQTGSYDAQDGTKRYTTDIICDNCTFLSPKGENSGSGSYSSSNYNNYDNSYNSAPYMDENPSAMPTSDVSKNPFEDFGEEISLKDNFDDEIALSDDDLPF